MYEGYSLMKYLPEWYNLSDEVVEIQEAITGGTADVWDSVYDLQDQMFVDTATWGLVYWERLFNITTDITETYEERREQLKAKMRSRATATVEMIKNVAESFVNGEVNITEHNDQYSFDVEFVSVVGVPSNIDALKRAIEEVKPAHLAVNYIINYNTWNDVADAEYTWNMASAKTWDELKGDEL